MKGSDCSGGRTQPTGWPGGIITPRARPPARGHPTTVPTRPTRASTRGKLSALSGKQPQPTRRYPHLVDAARAVRGVAEHEDVGASSVLEPLADREGVPAWSKPQTWDSSQRLAAAAGVPNWRFGPRTAAGCPGTATPRAPAGHSHGRLSGWGWRAHLALRSGRGRGEDLLVVNDCPCDSFKLVALLDLPAVCIGLQESGRVERWRGCRLRGWLGRRRASSNRCGSTRCGLAGRGIAGRGLAGRRWGRHRSGCRGRSAGWRQLQICASGGSGGRCVSVAGTQGRGGSAARRVWGAPSSELSPKSSRKSAAASSEDEDIGAS